MERRYEQHAEFAGTLAEAAHDTFGVALLVVLLALVGVFLALGEHQVDQSGQLVRCRRNNTVPPTLTPCTAKMFFAKSIPVAIIVMALPLPR